MEPMNFTAVRTAVFSVQVCGFKLSFSDSIVSWMFESAVQSTCGFYSQSRALVLYSQLVMVTSPLILPIPLPNL